MRTVRVGDTWDEAEANAKAGGENMAKLLERLLRRYNAAERRRKAAAPRD